MLMRTNPVFTCKHCGDLAGNCDCDLQIAAEAASRFECQQCFENEPAKGYDLCARCIGSNLHFGHDQIDEYAACAQPEVANFLAIYRRELAENLHNATLAVQP